MASSRKSLYLDLRENIIESQVESSARFTMIKVFTWIGFAFALVLLTVGLFTLSSTTLILMLCGSTDLEVVKFGWDLMLNQFIYTKWIIVTSIAIIGVTKIVEAIMYFIFLKKAPSRKLIIADLILWMVGLLFAIGGLLLYIYTYGILNGSYYRFENLVPKILICVASLMTIIGSLFVATPDIMLATAHKSYSNYGQPMKAIHGLKVAEVVFAAVEIGFSGFTWINILIFGTNKGGYSTFLKYLWVASYIINIVFFTCITASFLVESTITRKTSYIVQRSISTFIIYAGFVLSFYFACVQYFNNTQLGNSFELLAIFKIFVPSVFYLIGIDARDERIAKSIGAIK